MTLGVSGLDRAVRFYRVLGWERTSSSNKSISWLRTAGSCLGLFHHGELAAHATLPATPRAPVGGITL